MNVLLSCAGRRVVLVNIFREALRWLGLKGRILTTDMIPWSAAYQSVDKGFIVPSRDDPSFVEVMFNICLKNEVELVIPIVDEELLGFSKNRGCFKEIGSHVVVSAPETIEICLDKKLTHEWLITKGFPTVMQTSVEEVLGGSKEWSYPLLVKPRVGNGSRGVHIVEDDVQLGVFSMGIDAMVQTIAKGDEYTVDVFVRFDGEAVCAIPRKRLHVRSGEVNKAMTVKFPEVEELALDICRALPGAYGPFNVQIIVDENRCMRVIEINRSPELTQIYRRGKLMSGSRFNEVCPQPQVTSGLTSPPRALPVELTVFLFLATMGRNERNQKRYQSELGSRSLIKSRVVEKEIVVKRIFLVDKFFQICPSFSKFSGISYQPSFWWGLSSCLGSRSALPFMDS